MVIFEDNHLLVLRKQPGILSQADYSGAPDLLTQGKEYIRKTYQKPGNVFLGLVHRLDRNVGGVMVFARTSKAASRLSEQIRNNLIKKEYLVVVEGITKNFETLEHSLLKDEKQNVSRVMRVADDQHKQGKLSTLTYTQLGITISKESDQEMSLLEVELITGRSHQIRAQLSFIGHPIVGDVKYGAKSQAHGGKSTQKSRSDLALFAHRLTFKHPTRDEMLSFEAFPENKPPWSHFSGLFSS